MVTKVITKMTASAETELKISILPMSLGNTGVASAIVEGKLDGGLIMQEDFDQFKLGQNAYAYSLPLLFNSRKELDYVREKMDMNILKEMSNGPYTAVSFMEQSFLYVMSVKRLRTLSDWSKRTVWVPEESLSFPGVAKAIDTLTLKLATIPKDADIKESLENKQINTLIIPPLVALMKKWHRKMNFFYNTPFMYSYGVWIIKDESLQSLSLEEQQKAKEIIELLALKFKKIIRNRNIKVMDVFNRREMTMVQPNSDMKKAWLEWRETINKAVTAESRPTPTIANELQQHLNTFRKNNY